MNYSFCQACGISKPVINDRYCIECWYIINPTVHPPTRLTPLPQITDKPRLEHIKPVLPHTPLAKPLPTIMKKKKKESQAARRKRRILENGGSHTQQEWNDLLLHYNHQCAHCGIKAEDTPQKYLTKDHIIPVYRGGRDDIANIQPLCLRCNFKKSTRI